MRPRDLVHLWREFQLGLRYGYPLCCIAHYCWDGLWGWPSSMTRWRQIADDPDHPDPFVPCGIWHDGGSALSLGQRIHAILMFQARHLAPTKRGRTQRALVTRGSRRWQGASTDEKRWFSEQAALANLYWNDGALDPELEWR
jgi:hypothetical protein